MSDLQNARTGRPAHLSQEAVACLEALAREGLGDKLSLGGALGLLHYLDYRPTFDVDAWWEPATTEDERRRVLDVIQGVLATMGQVRVRAWGDVVSVELCARGASFLASRLPNEAPACIRLLSPPGSMFFLTAWMILAGQQDGGSG